MYKKQESAMARLLQVFVAMFFGAMLMTSCMGDSTSDSDSSVVSNVCYISSVKFNTMRRPATVKASDGVTDSTYMSTFTTTSWVFSVDHRNLMVENRDSMPHGTDLSKCVMALAYRGAMAYYRASDAWDDDPWMPYAGTDSIDLRKPLHIRVVATDNTERLYTLKVNVHTMPADSLRWVGVECDPALDGSYPMKAMGWDGKMSAMVNDGSGVMWLTHELTNLGAWERSATNLPTTTDVLSLAGNAGDGKLYVNTTDGALYVSADGVEWTLAYQREGLRLAGLSNERVYIMAEGALHSAASVDSEWQTEKMDEVGALLPDGELAFLTYTDQKNVERMLLVGNRTTAGDTAAVVWSKAMAEHETESQEGWMHYNRNWDNNRQLPMLEHLNVLYYDNKLMAAGGKSLDGTISALDFFRVSHDNGLTWWNMQEILPHTTQVNAKGYIAVGVDKNKFLWVIAAGKIYRGRLNRLAFDRPDIG